MAKMLVIKDDFLPWLGFANAGMLTGGNVFLMNYAIERISSSPIVEIGTFCGLSTNAMAYLLRKHKKANRIYSADKWVFEGSEQMHLGASGISHADYREFVKSSYLRNVAFFSPTNTPFTIEVVSDEFFELWGRNDAASDVFGRSVTLGGPISFCYVDGDHTPEFVRRDFENTDRYLEAGGFILFDDSADGDSFGLTPLMSEISQRGDYRLVMQNPNYLFQKL
jgi:hypothetical protein